MEKIDWDKAPEGATHCYARLVEFYKKTERGWLVWFSKAERWDSGIIALGRLEKLIPRPSTAWSGEGLPPVGTVCEFCGGDGDPEDPWHVALKDGAKVTVIAHYKNMGSDVAVFTFHDDRENVSGMQVDQATASCFRPIRTPEQIAADEREAALLELINDAGKCVAPRSMEQAARIYDAGWRKQPKP